MRIDTPASPTRLSLQLKPTDLPAGLRLGSELNARVRIGADGRMSLELDGNLRLPLAARQPLQAGEQLALRVTQLRPTVVLQVLARTERPLDQALKALLPRPEARQPLPQALSLLPDATQAKLLPPLPREALAALIKLLPRPQDLSQPDGLRRVLTEAGLFLEARLAGTTPGAPAAPQDLKAALLRLAQLLRDSASSAPPPRTGAPGPAPQAQAQALADDAGRLLTELGGRVEQAIGRLELLQLHAAQPGRLDLLFELPVPTPTGMDQLQLRIQEEEPGRESEDRGGAEEGFQVRLSFSFAGLGQVSASVRLVGEQVSVFWWTEQPLLAQVLEQHLDTLAARLSSLGLKVQTLECLRAAPPALDALPILQQRGILDERA